MIRTGDGKVIVFWRAKDRKTGREQNFRTHMSELLDFELMRIWVNEFYRHLELLEVRPWDAQEDGHRLDLYPVPVHNVMFGVRPELLIPEPRRISRSFFQRRKPRS